MRVLITILSLFLLTSTSFAGECTPVKLSSETLNILKPLIALRIKEHIENFTPDGRWKGESQYRIELNKKFYETLKNKTSAGNEAVAYLLNLYMGSHPDEKSVCKTLNRGKHTLHHINKYKKCIPLIVHQPLPKY